MITSACRRCLLILAGTLALCAIPQTSFAQCDWNTGSLFVAPYYSVQTWTNVVYAQGEDGSAGCCLHEYGLEIQIWGVTQSGYVVETGTEASGQIIWDPPSFHYSVRFWVGCYCVMSVVSQVEETGEEPLPEPIVDLEPPETQVFVGSPVVKISATVSPPMFVEAFSFGGDGETNPINAFERWIYTSSPGNYTVTGLISGIQRAQATVQVQAVPQCGDERDTIIGEYINYGVPLTLSCADFTQTRSSVYFTFAQLNTGDFSWALIRQPLIVGAWTGYGLDRWREAYGQQRNINSAYRNPARNSAIGGANASRHMFGDAVDMDVLSNTAAEWQQIVNALEQAFPSFIEPQNGPCGVGCVHGDWRWVVGGYQ